MEDQAQYSYNFYHMLTKIDEDDDGEIAHILNEGILDILNNPNRGQEAYYEIRNHAAQLSRRQILTLTGLLTFAFDEGVDVHAWYSVLWRIVKVNHNIDYVEIFNQFRLLNLFATPEAVFSELVSWMSASDVHSLKVALGSLYGGIRLKRGDPQKVQTFFQILYEGLRSHPDDQYLKRIARDFLPEALKSSPHIIWRWRFRRAIRE